MDIQTLTDKLAAQVVCGDVMVPDDTGSMVLIGKLFDTNVVLNETGQTMVEAMEADPAPRRRRRAPSDITVPVAPPVEASPDADAPVVEAVVEAPVEPVVEAPVEPPVA